MRLERVLSAVAVAGWTVTLYFSFYIQSYQQVRLSESLAGVFRHPLILQSFDE